MKILLVAQPDSDSFLAHGMYVSGNDTVYYTGTFESAAQCFGHSDKPPSKMLAAEYDLVITNLSVPQDKANANNRNHFGFAIALMASEMPSVKAIAIVDGKIEDWKRGSVLGVLRFRKSPEGPILDTNTHRSYTMNGTPIFLYYNTNDWDNVLRELLLKTTP